MPHDQPMSAVSRPCLTPSGRFLLVLLLLSALAGCRLTLVTSTDCSVPDLEASMGATLAQLSTDTDFSFTVERNDGRQYSYNRGLSTLQTAYESASTSKLVTAVIILRQVDAGYLKLSDRPQDWLPAWPITSSDPLYSMTLAQLLAFTAGLQSEPACLNSPTADFATCVYSIATANAGNGVTPGTQFYYASTYLQVAGLMAIRARGVASWQDLFSEFQSQTGLFPTATYDLPSATNPRLAGGMHWTGDEYLAFLKAYSNGELLSPTLMSQMLADQTAIATMVYSPPLASMGEDWHYGFGLWHECQSASFDCALNTRVSSPGAYGAYPFWDQTYHYVGLVARQGALGTFPNGVAVERVVQPTVEQWALCQ